MIVFCPFFVTFPLSFLLLLSLSLLSLSSTSPFNLFFFLSIICLSFSLSYSLYVHQTLHIKYTQIYNIIIYSFNHSFSFRLMHLLFLSLFYSLNAYPRQFSLQYIFIYEHFKIVNISFFTFFNSQLLLFFV